MSDATFAEALRRYRLAAGLSQDELATRAELSSKAISALERGERRNPYPHTIRALADDLLCVIEATAPAGPLVLGGHSMGGMTVLAYAGRHRAAFADRVRGTVLVSTTASVGPRTPKTRRRRARSIR